MFLNKKFRIGHYNILKGGEDRIDLIIKGIKKEKFNICGILEAVGWHNNQEYFSKKFKEIGFDYFYLAKANTKYNIVVVSKLPLKIEIINDNVKHVAIKASMEEKNLDIFFVHLSPVSEEERLNEIEIILNKIKEEKEVLILGDLNSLSPDDAYNKQALIDFFSQHQIKKYGDNDIETKVIDKLQHEDFIDIFKLFNKDFIASVPTLSNTDQNHAIPLRIDYAFVRGNSLIKKIASCKIIKNKVFNQASDHYPLILEIKK